jgi:hypothetical protein
VTDMLLSITFNMMIQHKDRRVGAQGAHHH